MEFRGTGSHRRIPPRHTLGDEVTPPARTRHHETQRQTPVPDEPHYTGKRLDSRLTSITSTSTSSFDTLSDSEVFELYTPPSHIPPPSRHNRQQHAGFQKGKHAVLKTGVRGTSALQFLTPMGVIRTPERGDIREKMTAGYGNITHRRHDIHSSSINLDEPVGVTCRNVSISKIMDDLLGKGKKLFPEQVPNPLSTPVTSTAPTGLHLNQSIKLKRDTDEALHLVDTTDDETTGLQKDLEETRDIADQLKRSTSKLVTDISRLKSKTHKSTISTAVQASQVNQNTQTPLDNALATTQLLKRLESTEQSLLLLQNENDSLKQTHQRLQSELRLRQDEATSLGKQLEEMKSIRQKLELTCHKLQRSDTDQRKKIKDLIRERDTLNSRIHQLEQELLRSNHELQLAKNQLTEAQENNHTLQQRINTQLKENQSLKKENEALSRKQRQTQQQLDASETSLHQTEEKLAASEQRLAEAQKTIESLRKSLDKSRMATETTKSAFVHTKLLNAELSKEKITWQHKKAELEGKLEITERRLHELQQERDDYFEIAEQLSEENSSLTSQLKKTKRTLKATEQKVKSQSHELKEKQKEVTDLNRTLEVVTSSLTTKKDQLQGNLTELETRTANLARAIRTQRPDNDLPQTDDITTLEIATHQLLSDHSTASSQLVMAHRKHSEDTHTIANLKRELSRKSSDLDKEKGKLHRAQSEITDIKQTLKESEDNVQKATGMAQEAIEELEKRVHSEVLLSEENSQMKRELEQFRSQEQARVREVEDLKRRLEQIDKDRDTLKDENTQLTAALSKERKDNQTHRSTINTLKRQAAENASETLSVKNQLKKLEDSVSEANQRAETAEAHLESQRQLFKEKERQLGSLQTQFGQAQTSLKEKDIRIEKLQNLLKAKEAVDQSNRELMAQLTASENTRSSLQQQLTGEKDKVLILEREKQDAVNNLRSLETTISSQTAEIQSLENQRDHLKTQLAESSSQFNKDKKRLEDKLEESNDNLHNTTQSLSQMKQETSRQKALIAQHEADLQKKDTSLRENQAQLHHTITSAEQKVALIRTQKMELLRLQNEVQKGAGLQEAVKQKDLQLQDQKREREALTLRLTVQEQELKSAEDRYQQLLREKNEQGKSFESERRSLTEKISALRTTVESLTNEITELRENEERLNRQLSQHKSSTKEKDVLTNKLRETEATLTQKTEQLLSAQTNLSAQQTLAKQFKDNWNATVDELALSQKTVEEKQRKIEELTQTLTHQQTAMSQYETALEETSSTFQNLISQTVTLSDKLDHATEQQKVLASKLEEQQKDYDSQVLALRQELQTEKETSDSLRNQYEALFLTTESLKERNKKLSRIVAKMAWVSLGKDAHIHTLTTKLADVELQVQEKDKLVATLQQQQEQVERDWFHLQTKLADLVQKVPLGDLPEEAFKDTNNLADELESSAVSHQLTLENSPIRDELIQLSQEWQLLSHEREQLKYSEAKLAHDLRTLSERNTQLRREKEDLLRQVKGKDRRLAFEDRRVGDALKKLDDADKRLKKAMRGLEEQQIKVSQLKTDLSKTERELRRYQHYFGILTEDSQVLPPPWKQRQGVDYSPWIPRSTYDQKVAQMERKLKETTRDYDELFEKEYALATEVFKQRSELTREIHKKNLLLSQLAELVGQTITNMEVMQKTMRDASASDEMAVFISLIEKLKGGLTEGPHDLEQIKEQLRLWQVTVSQPDQAAAIRVVEEMVDLMRPLSENDNQFETLSEPLLSPPPTSPTNSVTQKEILDSFPIASHQHTGSVDSETTGDSGYVDGLSENETEPNTFTDYSEAPLHQTGDVHRLKLKREARQRANRYPPSLEPPRAVTKTIIP